MASCTAPGCGAGTAPALRAELLFGLSMPGGDLISPAQWRAFLDDTVTPRFPAGLTVLDGAGQWTGPDGVLPREPAKVLLVVAPPGDATTAGLEAIRRDYRARFAQQSVGLVLAPACAGF